MSSNVIDVIVDTPVPIRLTLISYLAIILKISTFIILIKILNELIKFNKKTN